MKRFKKLLIALSGLALSMGAAVGVGLGVKDSDNETRATNDKYIYVDFDLNSKFKEAEANPWVRYYNGSQNYVQLNHVSNNIYRTASQIPSAVLTNRSYGFEIYCYNQAEQGNDCTTTWIFGNGVLQYDNYNYLCVGAYVKDSQNTIKGFGYYGTKTTNPDASANTHRVWLKNDTPYFYGNDDWGVQCKNVIGYSYNSAWYEIVMPAVQNVRNSNYYFYADIPLTVTSVHFMRKSQGTNHDYLTYLDAYVETLSYGVCYYSGTSNYDDFVNISAGSVDASDEAVLSAVLSAYVVCTNTAANGANQTTVHNLYGTWIEHKHGSTDMDTTFKDYANGAYTGHGNSYSGLSKNTDWKLSEKWEALCKHASVNPSTGALLRTTVEPIVTESNNTAMITVLASSVIALLAVGGYFFLRRKQDR